MEIFETIEVRWFGEGEAPQGAFASIAEQCKMPLRGEEPRTDRYLCLPSARQTGVKVREGRLEVKWLERTIAAPELQPLVAELECWRKRGFICDPATLEGGDEPWAAVEKERRLLDWAHDGTGLSPVGLVEFPAARCAVEFSGVRRAGRSWWSVCVEAHGPMAGAAARRVIEFLEPRGLALLVAGAHLQSYPAWLAEAE